MYVTSKRLDAGALARIAESVADETYNGNIVAESSQVGVTRSRVRLNAADSRKIGARRSFSGRHGRWSCWHAFRDVFAAWLMVDPNATIRTGVATYRGRDDFLAKFPETGNRNIGSLIEPLLITDACDCEADDDGRDVRDDARDYVSELS